MAITVGASKNLGGIAGALNSNESRRSIAIGHDAKDVVLLMVAESKAMECAFSVGRLERS
jgi:hypothetical protein